MSEPINFQSKNTVSSKRAESRGEALIENKVLVTAAWPSPLTFHSAPPIPPSPLFSSTSLYLILSTFVRRSINYCVQFSGCFPGSVFVFTTFRTLINFTLYPSTYRKPGNGTFGFKNSKHSPTTWCLSGEFEGFWCPSKWTLISWNARVVTEKATELDFQWCSVKFIPSESEILQLMASQRGGGAPRLPSLLQAGQMSAAGEFQLRTGRRRRLSRRWNWKALNVFTSRFGG